MMVIYVPVKYEFDWTNCFRVRVQKRKCGRTDGWTNGQKTDKRMDGITVNDLFSAPALVSAPYPYKWMVPDNFY